MEQEHHRGALIRILRNAYSGEQAAALAYRGHWRSLRDSGQRQDVRRIEEEEWLHRRQVGAMLHELGAVPGRVLEIRTWLVGRVLGIGCHLIGWFLPMYFAGRLEQGNAAEYDTAAAHARALGRNNDAACLATMADVEREHEVFFRAMVAGHRMLPLARRLFGWG